LVGTYLELIQKINELYKRHTGGPSKECDNLECQDNQLKKEKGILVEPKMYRKRVRKIMYLFTKIMLEGANMAREPLQQFRKLGLDPFKEQGHFVGYLKCRKDRVKIAF
jgi:hypothetical protein